MNFSYGEIKDNWISSRLSPLRSHMVYIDTTGFLFMMQWHLPQG